MASGRHEKISVQDIGLTGHTVADGLAVGRPSGFVCNMMESLVSGVFTVSDGRMLEYQSKISETEGIRLEPSACAGFGGLSEIERTGSPYAKYLEENGLSDLMPDATHIVWATGGGLMP
jgi:D-serine dehydratase